MKRTAALAAVKRLPPGIADAVRRPLPPALASSPVRGARAVALRVLREGGIPRRVPAFRLPDNPNLSFIAAESLVLSQLYWYGEQGWEPDLLPWWRHFCSHSKGVLELGANVGYFSVQGAKAAPSVRYVAVEPHPVSLEMCRANLSLNAVRNVELIGAAAVADPDASSVQLRVPSDQLATPTVAFMAGDHELPPDMVTDGAKVVEAPAVHVCTLLDGIDLLKLDVEGHEHALLTAARSQLAECRPTLIVEVLPGTAKLRKLLVGLCEQQGYRCYVPTRGRLVLLEPAQLLAARLMEEYGNHDVILSTTELPARARDLDGSRAGAA